MIRSANQYVYDWEIFHWIHNRCPFLVEDLVYQGSRRLATYDASPGDLESAQRIECMESVTRFPEANEWRQILGI